MEAARSSNWVTSKEILEKTNISRGTLNNYIKLGILPRPIVETSRGGGKGPRRIGYFPPWILERLREVQALKNQGHSMKSIAQRLSLSEVHSGTRPGQVPFSFGRDSTKVSKDATPGLLRVSLERTPCPAYLLDHDFYVVWTNQLAEQFVFHQDVGQIERRSMRNVFRLLFHWAVHEKIHNWKDLVAFHLSLVKTRFPKAWITRLYEEIPPSEASLLESLYDRVRPFPGQVIGDTSLSLLIEGAGTRIYRVYILFCKEGMLLLYSEEPPTHLRP